MLTTRPSSTDHSFFSSSKSSKPGASSSSTVVVRTRLARIKPPTAAQSRLRAPPGAPAPSGSSQESLLASRPSSPPPPPSTMSNTTSNPPRKRKSSTSSSAPLPRNVKRLRAAERGPRRAASNKAHGSSATSSRSSSRPNTHAPSPEPIYRSSRSRSVSAFHNPEPPVKSRPCWIEEDGTPGPSFLSSETVVKTLIRHYKGYFKNLDDPNDQSFEPENLPVAELEYPNAGACERFLLLAPKDKDHYNPIFCLEKSLYAIIESYLTPEQQSRFGTLPTNVLYNVSPPNTPPPSPSPSPPHSRDSNSSRTSSLSTLTSLSSSSSERNNSVNYLRAIQRAIHQRDGPLFLKTVNAINALLRSLKYPTLPSDICAPNPVNALTETVRSWTTTGVPPHVVMRVVEETYQRAVGPHVQTFRKYEAFSSAVYGELTPPFVSEIVRSTGLGKESLLVDLGSGVGNVVMQASLESGCRSFGVELMPAPAKVAREQLEQFRMRCRMWGVAMGEVELEEGDMLKSDRLNALIPQADVVLVNNKVFLESLNEALRPKFLDLKEGAVVVSLKPFVSSLNARVTERNVDDISAIFEVTEHPYRSGSVSWGSSGGTYYVHRVAREEYANVRQRFESSRSNRIKRQRS